MLFKIISCYQSRSNLKPCKTLNVQFRRPASSLKVSGHREPARLDVISSEATSSKRTKIGAYRTQQTTLRQGCHPLGWHPRNTSLRLDPHYSNGGLGIGTESHFFATRKRPVSGLVAIGVRNHLLLWKITFAISSCVWIHCW